MSDWRVTLLYQDDQSNKYWRARCEDAVFTVNFGRVGTAGQTQTKQFASAAEASNELDKQTRAKRKKGYVDAPADFVIEAPTATPSAPKKEEKADKQAPAPAESSLPDTPDETRLVLILDQQPQVELKLRVEGNQLHTVVVEHHPDAEQARAALRRLQQAMEAEGYRAVGNAG